MSIGKAIKSALGTVAPALLGTIAGPLPGLAMKFLANKIAGGDEEKAEQWLEDATTDPEKLAELKQIDADFKTEMRRLGIKEKSLHYGELANARDLAKDTSIWPQLTLTFLAIFAFGAVLYVLIMNAQVIPAGNKDLVIFLVGQLSTFTAMGFAFFLGSSKSSGEKNKVIQGMQGTGNGKE